MPAIHISLCAQDRDEMRLKAGKREVLLWGREGCFGGEERGTLVGKRGVLCDSPFGGPDAIDEELNGL